METIRPASGVRGLLSLIDDILKEMGIPAAGAVASDVAALSAHFNGLSDIPLPGSYMSDARWRSAYLAYFFPANAVKAYEVIRRFDSEGLLPLPSEGLTLLDYGCGPGSAALGVFNYLREKGHPPASVILIDRSAAAIDTAKELLRRSQIDAPVQAFTRLTEELPSVHLALAFNVFNELDTEEAARSVERLLQSLVPEGRLLIVEPALRDTSRRLIALRDALLEKRFARLFWPCPHSAQCPGLTDERDWCHGSEDWERPDRVAELDRIIGNRKERLKYSALLLGRPQELPGAASAATFWRVVSDPLVERGKRLLYLCGGPSNERIRASLLDRHVSDANRDFTAAARYDRLLIEGEWVEKGDGFRLGPETRVRKMDS